MKRYSRNSSYTVGGPVNLGGIMTPMVKYLIIINACFFLLELLMGDSVGVFFQYFALVPERFCSDFFIWQIVTYMFLHSPVDPWHILLNMLVLWMFGIIFERMWGATRFLLFYLAGGVAGGVAVILAALFFGGAANIPTIGASGAIYALIMAFGIWFPEQHINIYFFIPVKAKYVTWGIVGITVLYAVTAANSGVSYAAHAGGLLAGYIMTSGIYRPHVFKMKIKRIKEKFLEYKYRMNLWALRKKNRHIRRVEDDDDDDDKNEYYH